MFYVDAQGASQWASRCIMKLPSAASQARIARECDERSVRSVARHHDPRSSPQRFTNPPPSAPTVSFPVAAFVGSNPTSPINQPHSTTIQNYPTGGVAHRSAIGDHTEPSQRRDSSLSGLFRRHRVRPSADLGTLGFLVRPKQSDRRRRNSIDELDAQRTGQAHHKRHHESWLGGLSDPEIQRGAHSRSRTHRPPRTPLRRCRGSRPRAHRGGDRQCGRAGARVTCARPTPDAGTNCRCNRAAMTKCGAHTNAYKKQAFGVAAAVFRRRG
jgi:hypothetical protein